MNELPECSQFVTVECPVEPTRQQVDDCLLQFEAREVRRKLIWLLAISAAWFAYLYLWWR